MSESSGHRRLWINLALAVCLGIGAIVAYTLMGSDTQAAAVSRTVRAEKGVVLTTVSATGNVKASEELAVNFQNSGVLTSATVQQGQKVERGQVLATEDSTAAANQVKTAEANLASAQAHLQQLLDGMTPQEKQQNEVTVQQANQSLANAKTSLVSSKSVARQDTASSTLSLGQAKQQQKVDAAKLAADQKDLTAANNDVETAQAAYDATVAATASAKSKVAADQAVLHDAQNQQSEHSGQAQLHQQEQSARQTALSSANSALQQAQQNQTAACSPDPTTPACLSAVAATASAQATVDSAQSAVTAGQAQAISDQNNANGDARAVSAANYAVSQSQSALSDSQSAESTAKSDLQTAQKEQDSLETTVESDQSKLRTDASQVKTAQTSLESTVARNSQTEQNAATSVVTARLAKQSTIAANAVKEKPASASDLASAQASVDTAEANLATAQTALTQTTLTAPASGTIASIGAVVGETVSGGGTTTVSSSSSSSSTGATASSPLFTLVDLDGLEVVAGFSETDAAKIRPGQPATVSIAALFDEKFAAHVVAIDTLSTVTSNVVTYNVTFVFDNPTARVKPGMSADVDVVTAQVDNAINVTSSAIRTTGSRSTVTVRRNADDMSVAVVTGLEGDSSTEIVSGIRVGTEVVLPTTTLSVGSGGTPSGFPAGGPPGGFGG